MSVTKNEIVRRFPHYARNKKSNPIREREIISDGVNNDPLITQIFAPDPVTGIPSSDLGIILSKDSAPEVAQYIRDTLMKPHLSKGTEDGEFALESMRKSNESIEAYAARLKELCSPKDE